MDDLPAMNEPGVRAVIEGLKDYEPGPQYDVLVELIDWELRAQISLGAIGKIEPSAAQIKHLAEMIASTLDIHLDVQPRPPKASP